MSEPLRIPVYVVRPARYRPALSLGIFLAMVGACLHYALRDRAPQRRGGVVAFLDGLGPVWPLAFGIAAAGIALAVAVRVGYVAAHTLAASVLTSYATALWWTAAAGAGGWVTACMTTGLAVHTLVLASSYSTEGRRS